MAAAAAAAAAVAGCAVTCAAGAARGAAGAAAGASGSSVTAGPVAADGSLAAGVLCAGALSAGALSVDVLAVGALSAGALSGAGRWRRGWRLRPPHRLAPRRPGRGLLWSRCGLGGRRLRLCRLGGRRRSCRRGGRGLSRGGLGRRCRCRILRGRGQRRPKRNRGSREKRDAETSNRTQPIPACRQRSLLWRPNGPHVLTAVSSSGQANSTIRKTPGSPGPFVPLDLRTGETKVRSSCKYRQRHRTP